MPSGFKIADAYVEIIADKDKLRGSVRGIPAAVGPDADRAGQDIGERVTRGLAEKVEQLSARVTKARRDEAKAADALKLAEVRLTEAREKGNARASQLLALQQRVTQAQHRHTDAVAASTLAVNRHADAQRKLGDSIADIARKAGPNAERGGRDLGSKLSQGLHLSIVRNSPLIVAGIAAALAAGAPAVLGAATALFGGIGIVAAAQSDQVQSAWVGTWHEIRDATILSARVIEPYLIGMATRVRGAFEYLRPALHDAFAEVGPQIDTLVTGLLRMTMHVMPGLVNALQEADPAIEGLASMLEKIGTGLGEFFDIIGDHAPAAGEAASALGDILANLLPILAELLGQGAELAAVVLPPLAEVLGVLADVLSAIGPALPAIVAGLMGLKVASAATGWIGGLADKLTDFASRGGAGAGVAGRLGGAIGGISASAGAAGAALGFTATALMVWVQAGKAADDMHLALGRSMAVSEASAKNVSNAIKGLNDSFSGQAYRTIIPGFIRDTELMGQSLDDLVPSLDSAGRAYKEHVKSLTDVGRAELEVANATQALEQAVDEYGPTSDEAAAASDRLKGAQADLERQQGELETAINGVTDAMIAQVQQAMAGIDSGFAYERALDQLQDAQKGLNEAMESGSAEEISDAFLTLRERTYAVAQAYGRQQADLSGLSRDSADYAVLLQSNVLAKLYELRDAAGGPKTKAAIQAQIDALEASGASLDNVSTKADNAAGKIEGLGKKTASPKVELDDDKFNAGVGKVEGDLKKLDGQKSTPKADLNDVPFTGIFGSVMRRVKEIAKQNPTPKANMNDGPFTGIFGRVMQRVKEIAKQNPTPTANMNPSPFSGIWSLLMGRVKDLAKQRPTPITSLIDRASAGINAVIARLAKVQSKSVTVTTVQRTVFQNVGVPGSSIRGFAATGAQVLPSGDLAIGRPGGGPVYGPGGPREDLVPAMGPGGVRYRLSAGEWIIQELSSRGYGDDIMRAFNAGTAVVSVPGQPPRTAFGPAASATALAAPRSATPRQVVSQQADGRTVHIGEVRLIVQTPLNLMSRADLRRATQILIEEIRKQQRELD
jgi:hypothetical protein